MSKYTKTVANTPEADRASVSKSLKTNIHKHTGFGHIEDPSRRLPIDPAISAGYSLKIITLAEQLKYQGENGYTPTADRPQRFEDQFYLQYAKNMLDSSFDSRYDQVLSGIDVAPDPKYAQYSYEEIISMANNGVNIPKAVLAWAKGQQEADIVDYVVISDSSENADENSKNKDTGESEVNKIRAEVKDYAIKSKKSQEDIEKNKEKTDEYAQKAADISRKQKNDFKNNSIDKTEEMTKEWKNLDKKKKDGIITSSEYKKYMQLSDKLSKNGEIIKEMQKTSLELDNFLDSIDNLTEETATGLADAHKTISAADNLSKLDDRLNIFFRYHAYKSANTKSTLLEDTLSGLNDSQLAFVAGNIGHDLERKSIDTIDQIQSSGTQEVVEFADEFIHKAKHIENMLGIESFGIDSKEENDDSTTENEKVKNEEDSSVNKSETENSEDEKSRNVDDNEITQNEKNNSLDILKSGETQSSNDSTDFGLSKDAVSVDIQPELGHEMISAGQESQPEQETEAAAPAISTPQPEQETEAKAPAISTPQPEQETETAAPAIVTSQPEQETETAAPAIVTSQPEQETETTAPAISTPQPEQETEAAAPAIVTSHPEQETEAAAPAIVTSQSEQETEAAAPAIATSQPEQETEAKAPAIVTSQPEQEAETTAPAIATSQPEQETEAKAPAIVTSQPEQETGAPVSSNNYNAVSNSELANDADNSQHVITEKEVQEYVINAVTTGVQPQEITAQYIYTQKFGSAAPAVSATKSNRSEAKESTERTKTVENKEQIVNPQAALMSEYGSNHDFVALVVANNISNLIGLGPTGFAFTLIKWAAVVGLSVLDLYSKKGTVDESGVLADSNVKSTEDATKSLAKKSKEIKIQHDRNVAQSKMYADEYNALNDASYDYQFTMYQNQMKLVEAGKMTADQVTEFEDPMTVAKNSVRSQVSSISDRDAKLLSTINEPSAKVQKSMKESLKSVQGFSALNDKLTERNENNDKVGDVIIAETVIAQGLMTALIATLLACGPWCWGLVAAWAVTLAKNAAVAATGVAAKLVSSNVGHKIDDNSQKRSDETKSLMDSQKTLNDTGKLIAKAKLDKMDFLPKEDAHYDANLSEQSQNQTQVKTSDDENKDVNDNLINNSELTGSSASNSYVRKDSDTTSGYNRSSLNSELNGNNPNDVKFANEYAKVYANQVREADEKSRTAAAIANTDAFSKFDTTDKSDIKLARFNKDGAIDSKKRSQKVNAASSTKNGRKRR